MIKHLRAAAPTFVLFVCFFLASGPAVSAEEPTLGEQAPDFALKSASGETVKLSQLKGRVVVLEWLNHGCPFVKKHYDAQNMQALQQKLKEKGGLWYSIISSAPGKQGHSTPEQALADKKSKDSQAAGILLDEDGQVGRLYGAKVTPHMFIVDAQGNLAYHGGIDSIPSTDIADIAKAQPHFANAMDAVVDEEEVKVKFSRPYGCAVKY